MITTLTGANDAMRQTALQARVTAFRTEHGDMAIEHLDGAETDYATMLGAVQSLPFLAARKLVILYNPSANKVFAEHAEAFLAEVAETNDVLIVEPKLDKRLGYYKLLKKQTDFQEFLSLDEAGLVRYLPSYAKEQGGTLKPADARALIDRVGTNQLILMHEVDKLLAYDSHITKQSIERLTERVPQSSIFELLDAALSGQAKRAAELYREQRSVRVEPQQVIAMLVWQLYIVAVVKTAGQRSVDTIAAEAKLSPFTVRKAQTLSHHLTLRRLKELIHELYNFDVRLKSESIDADEVVQYYLLKLASS